MKTIPLTQGMYALVDDADYEQLRGYHWQFINGYAKRQESKRPIFMHRQILALPSRSDGREGDHINGVTLDNRRSNLRIVSHAENMQNKRPHRNGKSAYRGVYWHKAHAAWAAQVRVNGIAHHGGYFRNEDEAARAAVQLRQRFMTHNVERAA